MRVKTWEMAPGLASARPPGSAKFAKSPTPGTDKACKCSAVARGGGGLGAGGIDRFISSAKMHISYAQCLKVTRPSFFLGGYHPSLKLSGIPTFTFIVSLTHKMDNI